MVLVPSGVAANASCGCLWVIPGAGPCTVTIDRREALALDRMLAGCETVALEPVVCTVRSPSASVPASGSPAGGDALARYDDNGNGMITCAEARRHGIAPVSRSHPAYRYMRDGDGDGVVCE